MKSNQFPVKGKTPTLFLLISFFAISFIHAQSTDSFLDKNMDGVSDDISHQGLNLNQDAYNSVKDTGDVIHTIPLPNSWCQGLTWDGNYLWCSEILEGTIYQLDPIDGEIIKSFDAPGNSVEGLAWDGTYLWASENGGGSTGPRFIYKIDPDDGSVIDSFEPDGVWIHGLTWDGQYLWTIDFSTHLIHQVDPGTGTNLKSLDTPATQCIGLTWDGSHLWTDDFGTDKLYCLSPEDGSVIFEVNSPHTNPRDLAWDGDYLWVLAAASSTIYQVDVGNTTSISKPDLSSGNIQTLSIYPNPMGANTSIYYTLKEKENIQVHLYNSSGILISTLINESQYQGEYHYDIKSDDLVAGVYYCVLQAEQQSIVKKLVKVQ